MSRAGLRELPEVIVTTTNPTIAGRFERAFNERSTIPINRGGWKGKAFVVGFFDSSTAGRAETAFRLMRTGPQKRVRKIRGKPAAKAKNKSKNKEAVTPW